MEKKDLMDNGWLELYLLGDLSPADAQLVEQALTEDNELRQMYQAMEADMETVAKENAVTPSPLVKERLFRRLELSSSEIKRKEVPVRNINPTIYTLIAASMALVFLLSSIWLYQKVNALKSDIQMVETDREQLNLDKETLASEVGLLKDELALLKDADTQKYIMKGNSLMPAAVAVSYVNHRDKKVILDHSLLPELPEGKTYQLWGDVAGKMIDMGVIPKADEMTRMTYLENAESLNITIEPAGGSEHPTVSQLVTNVNLPSVSTP